MLRKGVPAIDVPVSLCYNNDTIEEEHDMKFWSYVIIETNGDDALDVVKSALSLTVYKTREAANEAADKETCYLFDTPLSEAKYTLDEMRDENGDRPFERFYFENDDAVVIIYPVQLEE